MFAKVVIVAASTLLVSPVTAASQSRAEETISQTVRVDYSDLDVKTAGGGQALLVRVRNAAEDACGGKPFFDSRYNLIPDAVREESKTCRDKALSQAVSSLAIPELTIAYMGSTRAPAIRQARR